MAGSPRDRLIAKIAEQTDPQTLAPQSGTLEDFHRCVEQQATNPSPAIVVSIEDFFDGNADEGAIGCNMIPHPGLDHFRRVLTSIRDRPDVQDMLIEIVAIDDDPSWPFSDTVWVISSASEQEVEEWMEPLHPDEVLRGWGKAGKPPAAPEPREGTKVYGLWWD